MTLIYLFIIIFFIIFSFKSFKKSFLTYAAVSVIFNAAMALKYSPPAISCEFVLAFYFLIMFFFKRKHFRIDDNCFFKQAFVWCSISLIISSLVTYFTIGGISGFTSSFQKIITLYVFIFLFYIICKTKKDILYFCNTLISLYVIIFIYGFFEYVTKTNPILDIINNNMPIEFAQDKLYLSDLEHLRDGRSRCQSLFSISILYGIMSVLFGFFLIYLRALNFIRINDIKFYMLIVLSLFGCYACNSKTPLVALPVFVIPLLLRNKFLLCLDIFICFIILLLPDTFLALLGNIIDLRAFDANDSSVEGSSLYLRLVQLETSIDLWLRAPLFGNGLKSAAIFADKGYDIFGAESVWFRLMIEQGVLGLISYILLIISFIKASFKTLYIRKALLFYTLGFFLICSITDINYTMFFMCFIILYKLDRFIRKNHKAYSSVVVN